jgi:hypothetical protein
MTRDGLARNIGSKKRGAADAVAMIAVKSTAHGVLSGCKSGMHSGKLKHHGGKDYEEQ